MTTAPAIIQSGYAELARLIIASDAIDAVIMIVSARLATSFENEREALAAITRGSTKPILMWSYTLPGPDTARFLSLVGYPLFTGMRSCARTLAAMVRYRAIRDRHRG